MRHKFILFEKETKLKKYNIKLELFHPWYNYICIKPVFSIYYDNPKEEDWDGFKPILDMKIFFIFGFDLTFNKLIKY